MKRTMALLMALLFMLCTVTAYAESYSATQRGFGGDITVTLTIEGNKLVGVEATGDKETVGVGTRALEELSAAMLAANSVEVDIISGATFTSKAVLLAAQEALAASSAVLTPNDAKKEAVIYQDTETDVVIVGGGIAGISAMIEATDNGLSAILIEKTGMLGGAAVVSAGAMWAIDSDAAMKHNRFTADEIYEFFSKKSGPVYNKELFYNLANDSNESYHFLLENGVTFPTAFQCNPQADPRFWGMFSANRGGGMMSALIDAMNARNVDIRLNQKVDRVITDETGAVIGVSVSYEDGSYTIYAKNVILATGGFGQNSEMFAEYVPGYDRIPINRTYVGATGDGHRMVAELGGELIGYGSMGSVGVPTLTADVVLNPAADGQPLVLNVEGEQVCASNEHYTKIYMLCLEASDGTVYTIYPSDIADYTDMTVERLEDMVADGGGWKGETFEELADYSGVNKEAFLKTVAMHNQQIEDGVTDAFNTPIETMIPLENGPFYLIMRVPACIGTITGVTVDEHLHVAADGKTIENLYAVGELIYGNWFNQGYPMSGTGLGGCVSSARLAVKDILSK